MNTSLMKMIASLLLLALAGCGKSGGPLAVGAEAANDPLSRYTEQQVVSTVQPNADTYADVPSLAQAASEDNFDHRPTLQSLLASTAGSSEIEALRASLRQQVEVLKPKIQSFIQEAKSAVPACKQDLAVGAPELTQYAGRDREGRRQQVQAILNFFRTNSQSLSPECQQFTQRVASLRQQAQARFTELKAKFKMK